MKSSEHFMYDSWLGMRQRCSNKNHKNYNDYGGRGITVCERWNSFKNFLEDMGERPSKTTLDRIDNTKGYSPENCKWSSQLHQVLNSRIRKNKTSKYRGVFRHKTNDRWVAKCNHKYLGCFKKELDAAAAYNKAAIENFKEAAKLNKLEK